jgi:hypothetical protein
MNNHYTPCLSAVDWITYCLTLESDLYRKIIECVWLAYIPDFSSSLKLFAYTKIHMHYRQHYPYNFWISHSTFLSLLDFHKKISRKMSPQGSVPNSIMMTAWTKKVFKADSALCAYTIVVVCVCGLRGLIISFVHIVQVFENNVATHLSASVLQLLFHDEVHRPVKDQFQTNPSYDRSRDSSVGEGLGRRIVIQFPLGAKVFPSPSYPDRLWAQSSHLYDGYRELFPRR